MRRLAFPLSLAIAGCAPSRTPLGADDAAPTDASLDAGDAEPDDATLDMMSEPPDGGVDADMIDAGPPDCGAYPYRGQVYDCTPLEMCIWPDDLAFRVACCTCHPIYCSEICTPG
jgi:hypothetical protein